jgi:hypothetical protein
MDAVCCISGGFGRESIQGRRDRGPATQLRKAWRLPRRQFRKCHCRPGSLRKQPQVAMPLRLRLWVCWPKPTPSSPGSTVLRSTAQPLGQPWVAPLLRRSKGVSSYIDICYILVWVYNSVWQESYSKVEKVELLVVVRETRTRGGEIHHEDFDNCNPCGVCCCSKRPGFGSE